MQTPGLQTAGAVAVLRKNSAAILPVEESEEMSMEKITITEKQKEIIQRLNDPHYTVEILQEWVNRNDNVFVNAPAALEAMGAKGFFAAVRAIERAEQDRKDGANKTCPLAKSTTKHGGIENAVDEI